MLDHRHEGLAGLRFEYELGLELERRSVESGLRMYLSSFRVGNCPDRLVEFAKGGTRAAVVANAMDAAPPQVRREAATREIDALTALRFVAEELDLRDYFGTSGAGPSDPDASWPTPPRRPPWPRCGSA
jgi:hypothetical protein